jgi:hypothetical protein
MAKYYTNIRISKEVYRKIIKARGKLEQKTGEKHSLEDVVEKALDTILLTA